MAERSKRGFASMDREKQRQIASKGGKAAHVKGTAHEFTREEAIEAGRKGGKAAHAKGTAHRFPSQEAEQAVLPRFASQQPSTPSMAGTQELPLGGSRAEQSLPQNV